MTELQFLFSRSRNPGAVLVRAAEWWGPWAHVGVISDSGGYVIEARAWMGVVATPLRAAKERSSCWEIVELPSVLPGRALSRAEKTLGCGYDWAGLLGIPFRERSWDDPGRWYCSEHAAWVASEAGVDLVHSSLHGVAPNMLRRLMHAAGGYTVAHAGRASFSVTRPGHGSIDKATLRE